MFISYIVNVIVNYIYNKITPISHLTYIQTHTYTHNQTFLLSFSSTHTHTHTHKHTSISIPNVCSRLSDAPKEVEVKKFHVVTNINSIVRIVLAKLDKIVGLLNLVPVSLSTHNIMLHYTRVYIYIYKILYILIMSHHLTLFTTLTPSKTNFAHP